MTTASVRLAGLVKADSSDGAAIRNLLLQTSSEFVPSLHTRVSTTSKSLAPVEVDGEAGFNEFVAQTLNEHCLIAEVDGRFVGFMSFLPHYNEELIPDWSPCTYVVTIAADPTVRKAGVGRALYDAVFALPENLVSPYIATRTWVGNGGHIALLGKLGFSEVHRIENDRGEGVHTVYFARSIP